MTLDDNMTQVIQNACWGIVALAGMVTAIWVAGIWASKKGKGQ